MHDLRCLVTIFIRLGHLKLQIDRIKLIKCLKHINHFSCQCQIRQKNYVGPSWSKGLRLVIESLLTCEKITTRLGPRQSHDHKHLQWLLHRALFNSHSNTLSLSLSLSLSPSHSYNHTFKQTLTRLRASILLHVHTRIHSQVRVHRKRQNLATFAVRQVETESKLHCVLRDCNIAIVCT